MKDAILRAVSFMRGDYAIAALRIFTGALLLFAGIFKVFDPQSFALIVAKYRLLPAGFVPLAALVMPWIEVICGMFLVAGYRTRGAALVSLCLMAAFAVGISVNYVRGESFDCGCFELDRLGMAFDETIGPWAIVRDLALMVGFFILYRVRSHAVSVDCRIEKGR